jgi:hypothetical protein
MFDLLEHMVAHELLPLEWLATECMRPIWDRLVRSTSNNDHRTVAHAYRFFEVVTLAGIGLPDERLLADETIGARRFVPSSKEELRLALGTTYSSLLTVMCSIALVNNSRDDDAGRQSSRSVTWLLDAVAVAVLIRNDVRSEFQLLEPHVEDAQTFLQRATWTIFASFVVHLDHCPTRNSTTELQLQELVSGLNWLVVQYELKGINTTSILGSLPALISSIARGTGRIWKDDGFDQLQRLVQTLMTLSGYRLPHKLWTMKRLALESAVEFAQDTCATEHGTYARMIEQKMRTQGQLVIVPSPHKNDSPSSSSGGFKWEEGIGEWVACTPFAAKQGVQRMARKPIPALDLLPTPAQSEDEEALPEDSAMWETTAFEADDDDCLPQSSPIKKAPRLPMASLGKRQRASSPMVIVPVKRTKTTPPDTPVEFYSVLPEDETEGDQSIQGSPRRSRRSTGEIKQLASRLRTQRSRASLEGGLRTQQRKTYVEPIIVDIAASSDNDSESENDKESTASSEEELQPQPQKEALRRSRGRPARKIPDNDTNSVSSSDPTSPPQLKEPQLHGRGGPPCTILLYDGTNDDADERDDLGITPAHATTKRRTSSRNEGKIPWWKLGRHAVVDSEDDGSEDELSFY